MRTRTFFLCVAIILCLSGAFAYANERTVVNEDVAQEQIRLLYSSRLSFDDKGVPLVGVGLMDGLDKLEITAEADLQATVYNHKTRKVSIGASGILTLRLRESAPGRTVDHVVVDSIAQRDREELTDLVQIWKNQGVPTTILRIGSILSLQGEIVNNVRFLLVAGTYYDEKSATAHRDRLNGRFDTKAYLFRQIETMPSGVIEVLDAEGRLLVESRNLLRLTRTGQGPIFVPNCTHNQGFHNEGVSNRSFSGSLYVTLDRNGKLALGNAITIEEVLKGTVPSEIFPSAPMDALKAQAVAARGQLLAKLGVRHLADPFHICASQHCQVYHGANGHTARTDQAVEQTRGQFLFGGEGLVDTVYSASSGGYTENNESVWPQIANPNLRGKLDGPEDRRFSKGITESNLDAFLDSPPVVYSSGSGYNQEAFRWTRSYSAAQISSLVNRSYNLGRILELKPLRRGVSGRVNELEIIGSEKSQVVHGELRIRRLLGDLRSSLIRIRIHYGENGEPRRFIIDGAGFGHGVGLCQTGAIGRALVGQSYETILKHYYGNSRLKTLY